MHTITQMHKQRAAPPINHQRRPRKPRMTSRQHIRHRPRRIILIQLKPHAMVLTQIRQEIGKYQIHTLLRQDPIPSIRAIIQNHLAEFRCIFCSRKQPRVSGYAVQCVGVLVVDCSADRLRTLREAGDVSFHGDLELLRCHGFVVFEFRTLDVVSVEERTVHAKEGCVFVYIVVEFLPRDFFNNKHERHEVQIRVEILCSRLIHQFLTQDGFNLGFVRWVPGIE